MPVTGIVKLFLFGLLNQFFQIGRDGFLSIEPRGKEKKHKNNKKCVSHIPGKGRKERLRLEKPEPEEFTWLWWLALKRDGLPWHREWL